ncbi:hypothetical protein OH76DRAFT_1552761 [Lentinus brumalis]|uniref:AAA-ATPase-like domain-containing protein n=1 Tax=Lentinus brumalis TaxID=2498619 RepID=A0A371DQM3_9APHY|nr:hypothetical protein OH76DRAFT_1552761 [Polyporus brumalis]
MVQILMVGLVLEDHDPNPFLVITETSVMEDAHATFEDLREDVRRKHDQICSCGATVGSAYLLVSDEYSGPRGYKVSVGRDEKVLWRLLDTVGKCQIRFPVIKPRIPGELPEPPFNIVSELICIPRTGPQRIPSLADRTFEALCNGCVFVDKLRFIHLFHCAPHKLEVLRRPSGFGRTTFLSTLAYFHDLVPPTDSKGIQFRHNTWWWDRASSAVLLLDFAQLDCSSLETLDASLNRILHEAVRDAWKKYSDKIMADPNDELISTPVPDATVQLQHFITRVNDAGYEVFFGIDNYTEPFARLHDWIAVKAVLDSGLYSALHDLVANHRIRYGLLVGSPLAPSANNTIDETCDYAESHSEGCPCTVMDLEEEFPLPFAGALRGVADDCSNLHDYAPVMGMSQAEIEALGEVVLKDGQQFYEEVKKKVDPIVRKDLVYRDTLLSYSFTGVLSCLQLKLEGSSLQSSLL